MSRARSQAFDRGAPVATPLYSALFLAFAVLCLLRVALNNRILDLLMNYTADGGSIVEKIHPAIWGFAAVALLVILNFRIELTEWELRVTRALLVVGAVASVFLVIGSMTGKGSSTGYLLDTYVSLVTIVALFAFPPAWRRQLGIVLLSYMIAGAALGILEFVFHVRLMPYTEGEPVFRPTGLTNHPLELGQWCLLALCLVAGLAWSSTRRLAVGALLFLGCVVSGARAATMAAFVCTIILLVAGVGAGVERHRRGQRRLIVFLSVVLAGPLVVGAMFAAGALSRFGAPVADSNAMSRVDIYGVLSLLSWRDLLLGGDIESVRKVIMERFSYDSIESSLLVFIVQFGLIGTAVFLGALARLARTVARGAGLPIGVAFLSFASVALSNNSLSVKSSSVFLIVVLGIAFHDEGRPLRGSST